MSRSNNTIILEDCIKDFKKKHQLELENSTIFEMFTASMITKKVRLSFEEIEGSIVDGGKDGGIDSFLIVVGERAIMSDDELEETRRLNERNMDVYIIQSKTEKTFKESTLDKIISTIPLIFDLEKSEDELLTRFNESLVEKVLLFRKLWRLATISKTQIKINYLYASMANEVNNSASFLSKVEQLKSLTKEKIRHAEVTCKSYSAMELFDLFCEPVISKLNLKFKETPIVTSYDENIGYLGIVNLTDFYKFIIDEENVIRENIFEYNIRHFQGAVDVNKMIRNTLENGSESQGNKKDFWWLNNGITIIASDCKHIGKELMLDDVQIVNGLQTSYTIGEYFRPGVEDDRTILVKIIISKDKDTIDQIISSTNRQNPVSPTLLRATDKLQRGIEQHFLNKGFFYDRRKNFYKNQGKASTKIFSIQFAAQAIQAIVNFDPSSARSKPTTLIKEDKTYKKIFNENTDFEVYLKCCLLVQKTSDYIKSRLEPNTKRVAKNFLYHLARFVVSYQMKKVYCGKNDLKVFEIPDIDCTCIVESWGILSEVIKDYQKKFPTENIINISKSKKFSDEIDDRLKKRFEI